MRAGKIYNAQVQEEEYQLLYLPNPSLLTVLQQRAYQSRLKINVASILKLASSFIRLQLSQSRLNRNLLLQRVIVLSWYTTSRRYQSLQSMLSALVRSTIKLLLTCLGVYLSTFLVLTYPPRTSPYYCLFLLVVLKQLYIVGQIILRLLGTFIVYIPLLLNKVSTSSLCIFIVVLNAFYFILQFLVVQVYFQVWPLQHFYISRFQY